MILHLRLDMVKVDSMWDNDIDMRQEDEMGNKDKKDKKDKLEKAVAIQIGRAHV